MVPTNPATIASTCRKPRPLKPTTISMSNAVRMIPAHSGSPSSSLIASAPPSTSATSVARMAISASAQSVRLGMRP